MDQQVKVLHLHLNQPAPFGSRLGVALDPLLSAAFQELCKDDKADFVCYSGDGHFVCSQCEVI